MRLHPYVDTFRCIVEGIQGSQLRFAIHKVKAHGAGIKGNDVADAIAKDIWVNKRYSCMRHEKRDSRD